MRQLVQCGACNPSQLAGLLKSPSDIATLEHVQSGCTAAYTGNKSRTAAQDMVKKLVSDIQDRSLASLESVHTTFAYQCLSWLAFKGETEAVKGLSQVLRSIDKLQLEFPDSNLDILVRQGVHTLGLLAMSGQGNALDAIRDFTKIEGQRERNSVLRQMSIDKMRALDPTFVPPVSTSQSTTGGAIHNSSSFDSIGSGSLSGTESTSSGDSAAPSSRTTSSDGWDERKDESKTMKDGR